MGVNWWGESPSDSARANGSSSVTPLDTGRQTPARGIAVRRAGICYMPPCRHSGRPAKARLNPSAALWRGVWCAFDFFALLGLGACRTIFYRLFKWEKNPIRAPGLINLPRGYVIDLFPGTLSVIVATAQKLQNCNQKEGRRLSVLLFCQRYLDPVIFAIGEFVPSFPWAHSGRAKLPRPIEQSCRLVGCLTPPKSNPAGILSDTDVEPSRSTVPK